MHERQKYRGVVRMRSEQLIRETLEKLQKSPYASADKERIYTLRWVLGEVE